MGNIAKYTQKTTLSLSLEIVMKGELTAILEKAPEGGYWAICPEVPGANGQGETIEEAKKSLKEAVSLILLDRIEDI
jgi:predicted RNase H-like HicB family nuclease